jgi:hypothetical protein
VKKLSIKQKIKSSNLSALLIALLLISMLTTITIVSATNDDANGNGSDYGADQAQQIQNEYGNTTQTFNQTQNQNGECSNTETNACNQTASTERKQIQAKQQTQLQIRNTTMLINCTSNCDVVFSADHDVEPKLLEVNLDANRTMKLEMNLSKSPLSGAMVNERNLNFYLDIEPNATNQFRAQIKLYINQTEINQNLNREVNASRLTWMYWNQTMAQWEKVESYIDQNGYLVCNTDHFSTWTVAEEAPNQDSNPITIKDSSMSVVYIILGAAAVLGVIIVGAIAYKKRN